MLDEKLKTGGIGFRGEIRESAIVETISQQELLKINKRIGGK